MFDPAILKKWFKKAVLKQRDVALVFGFKTHSSITQKLSGATPWTADEIGKLLSMMKNNLSAKDMGECIKDIFGTDFDTPQQSAELLRLYKELAESRKELSEHKDKIRNLEITLTHLSQRYFLDRRTGDPPEVNPKKLRRPIVPSDSGATNNKAA